MKPGTLDPTFAARLGAAVTLGAPADWNPAVGECDPLVVYVNGGTMTSAWYPTDCEKAAIAAGAPVLLTVWSSGHPPVSVNAGPAPK